MNTETITVNGTRLEIQHLAPRTTVPAPASPSTPTSTLVFLHEGLGSVAMWRDWPQAVCDATGCPGLVYSRRGYGQSEPVPNVRAAHDPTRPLEGRLGPDYLHREAWEVLPALLAQLGVRHPVLLGHSDGGSIALLYASRWPARACIVLAPHVVVEDMSVAAIAQARDAYEGGELRPRLARYHADVDSAFWQWNDVWLSEAFRSFDIRADCSTISCPVLAMQGVDDPYGSMAQIEQIRPVHGHITLQKLEQCGHSPHRDQSELTTVLIQDFLQGLAPLRDPAA